MLLPVTENKTGYICSFVQFISEQSILAILVAKLVTKCETCMQYNYNGQLATTEGVMKFAQSFYCKKKWVQGRTNRGFPVLEVF